MGKTADGDNVYGGGSGDNEWSGLYKKDTSKEEFTPAEVKFVEMLAINQGKVRRLLIGLVRVSRAQTIHGLLTSKALL